MEPGSDTPQALAIEGSTSYFTENLLWSHLMGMRLDLDEGYRAMAADKTREADAVEWCNAIARGGCQRLSYQVSYEQAQRLASEFLTSL